MNNNGETLNVALLGCGRVGEWQANVFKQEITSVNVTVVCDLNEKKARLLARKLDSDWTLEYEDILNNKEVSVVVVMTESGNHYRHARQALLAGKHVIIEKPPCMLAEQVIELNELALERKLMFAPIFQNRFNPAMKALKQAMEEGRFGKIVCVSVRLLWCRYQSYYEDGWHGTWGMDGGVINQQAIHHVDAMHWICGSVENIIGFQANRLNELEAEDTTVALVKFENGALGTIEATTAARPNDKEASLTIIGEKGSVVIGGVALNKVIEWNFIERKNGDNEVIDNCSVEVPNGYGLSHGPLLNEIFGRIRSGDLKSPISVNHAVYTIKLIHALYRSVEDGVVVKMRDELLSRRLGFEL